MTHHAASCVRVRRYDAVMLREVASVHFQVLVVDCGTYEIKYAYPSERGPRTVLRDLDNVSN